MKKNGQKPSQGRDRTSKATNGAKVAAARPFIEGKETLGEMNARLESSATARTGSLFASVSQWPDGKPCPLDDGGYDREKRELVAGIHAIANGAPLVAPPATEAEKMAQGKLFFTMKDHLDAEIASLKGLIAERQKTKGKIAKLVYERLGKGAWKWQGTSFQIVCKKGGAEGEEPAYFFRGETMREPGVLG